MANVEPSGILESVLYADNLDAAESFYSGVLGLTLQSKAPARHVFFRCGEQMLLLFNPAVTSEPSTGGLAVPQHGASGPGHLCFRASADELQSWREHLTAVGVEIESEVEWPGGGRSIYFRDPAGNSLEFAEPRIWGLA